MKWKLLVTILCISCHVLFAQRVAMEIDKNNFFYCGVENPIKISVQDVKPCNIKLETDNGKLTKAGIGYIYVPMNKGISQIIIKQKIGKNFVHIESRTCRIILVPDPVALIGQSKHYGSRISGWDSMRAVLVNFDFDVSFNIESFYMVIKRQDSILSNEVYNKTGRLSEKANNLIKSAEAGDIIVFDRIFATGPDGITRHLQSITIPYQE